MKIALQAANKRRTAAEEELDRLLTNPILSSVKPSTSDEAIQKEHLALSDMLKEKECQVSLVTTMFLQKEQELQNQIKVLQAKLEEAQRAVVLKEQIQIELPQQEGPVVDKEFSFEARETQEAEEAGSSEAPKPDEWAQLTESSQRLSQKAWSLSRKNACTGRRRYYTAHPSAFQKKVMHPGHTIGLRSRSLS